MLCSPVTTSMFSGVARVFFTIASNTPGPEASQLQTNGNYGTGGASECKSCAPGDLAAQGYGHYPSMRRLRVHRSWVVSRRVQISQQTSSIDKYFEQKETTSPSVSPGRQLSEANAKVVEAESENPGISYQRIEIRFMYNCVQYYHMQGRNVASKFGEARIQDASLLAYFQMDTIESLEKPF